MSAKKNQKSFYIKDTRGKLIILSESALLSMIKDKGLKPSTKVFNKDVGSWMKISDLNIYSNRSSIDLSEVNDEQLNIEEVQSDDTSIQIIQLLDTVEDAKEAIFTARYEGLEKSKKIALKNNELKAQLTDASIKIHSYEVENKALQDRIKSLQNEKIELLQQTTFESSEVENSKLKSQNNKLKQQLKLVELDYKNELEINNNLIIQIEGLKKEAIELYERKEFHETQFNKIEKERVHFQENVQIYKVEIDHLNHDRAQIQEQFNKLLKRHEEYLNQDNIYKEKYVEAAKTISELKNSHSNYTSNLNKLKDLLNAKEKEVFKLADELDVQHNENQNLNTKNDNLTRQVLHLEQQLANHKNLINDLRDIPPTPGGVEVVELLQNEVAHLKNLVKDKEEQLKTLRGEFVALKSSCVAMKTFQDTEMKRKELESAYNILFKKAKTITMKWRQGQKDNARLKQKLSEAKEQVIASQARESDKLSVVDNKIELAKESAPQQIEVQAQSVDERTQEFDLTEYEAELEVVSVDEFLGKRFELDDGKVWKVNHPEFANNLYNIFELKELVENNNLNTDINVKMLGRSWKKISNTFELNTHIIVEEINGVVHYFVERKSVRVPTQKRVQVLVNSQIADATCTNVSQGGCFLEFPRLPDFLKNDQELSLKIFLNPENTIIVNCVVKNIINSLEVFGVGLMFQNTPKSLNDWISEEIHLFITSEMEIKEAS